MELFIKYPIQVQDECLAKLIAQAQTTRFGSEYRFGEISNANTFKERVPIQDYNGLWPYIEKQLNGEKDVLWPGEVTWFARSSGTSSSRSKFIPVTKASLEDCHFKGGKDMLSIYCHNNPQTRLFTGKGFSIGGSHSINQFGTGSFYGDLSAVLMHNLPKWAEYHRTPDLEVALMNNWDEKMDMMIEKTKDIDVTSITGIPSWTLILCKQLLERTGRSHLHEVWPHLEVYFHGGVSFLPYRASFKDMIGDNHMNYLETYNASEGFFGIQDRTDSDDLLLMLDYGIYYEFVPVSDVTSSDPKVVPLEEVETGASYAMVISTNGGLWRYMIGDTVMFTAKNPFRIKITGRVGNFINAFGEELVIQNAEVAMKLVCRKLNARVSDYTAAPKLMAGTGKGVHQWLIEFTNRPDSLNEFALELDDQLKMLNSDYDAKRQADLLLQLPEIMVAAPGTFRNWLRYNGKLGGQHKVPRLCNDRRLMEELLKLTAHTA